MSMGRGNIMDKRKERVSMRRGDSSLLHYDAHFPFYLLYFSILSCLIKQKGRMLDVNYFPYCVH